MSTSTTTADLRIQGMSCRHCVDAVEGALGAIEGLSVEEVGIGRARVVFETRAVSPDALEHALDEAGYHLEAIEQIA